MGEYVQGNLAKGEEVVYEARLHWIIFISIKAILTLLIAPLIAWYTSEFAITNKRIIIKVGLISRRTLEMNLAKIESVNVDQSILGRILGYGTITVIGTGGTREPFFQISNPLDFRKAFQQLQS
ncbi:MAG: PH domain-containing protein [Syntrophaceae bacterium]|nr:PH domain-containing protein [Syntrophaceae bacterium]